MLILDMLEARSVNGENTPHNHTDTTTYVVTDLKRGSLTAKEGEKFEATLVQGNVSWPRVVRGLARLGGHRCRAVGVSPLLLRCTATYGSAKAPSMKRHWL